ncbi:stage IV sporulation protein A [Chryseomicrobium sp. FSL W7-1435]|uniref:stage IV sporulation protein A n=1 Tax=Chryseomicrobium sp. FSL W7-1435 TaxID=2921704 RepID=UPI00315B0B59
MQSALNELAKRTNGDVYIGVVGPVRVGKSTFISKLLEHLVLPSIEDGEERNRIIDEMPQSSAGQEIMTTEPKFIPAQAVSVPIQGSNLHMKLRFVDCVGYMVDSIGNHEKLIQTPWHQEPIPFQQAAKLGTDKVMKDHSTVGFVVSTDGTVNGLERSLIEPAEQEIIDQMKSLGKPFVLVINSQSPFNDETAALVSYLETKYEVPVEAASIRDLDKNHLDRLLRRLLFEFPIESIELEAPEWLELDPQNEVMQAIQATLQSATHDIHKLKDVDVLVNTLQEIPHITAAQLIEVDPSSGQAIMQVHVSDSLYEETCSKWLATPIQSRSEFLHLIQQYDAAKKATEKFSQALEEAIETGYGIALPTAADFVPFEPELIRENNFHGVRLRAKAPVLHIIRVDMMSEFAPLLGSEFHSQQLKNELQEHFDHDLNELWQTQLFGTTLIHVLQEGIRSKTAQLDLPVKHRLVKTIEKIVKQEQQGLVTFII